MKKFLIVFPLLLNSLVFTQTKEEQEKINNLKQKISITKNDSLKIEYLNDINLILNSNDIVEGQKINDKIIEIANKNIALNDSKKRDYLIFKSLAYNNKGIIYHDNGQINKALIEYKKGLKIDLELKIEKDIAASYLNIGSIYDYLGDYIQAISYYQKSLKIQKKIKNDRGISDAFNNIGVTYNTLKQQDKALRYFLLSLNLDRKLKDEIAESITLSNIGSLYAELKKYKLALSYTQKAYEITLKLKNTVGQGMTLGNIGSYYLDINELENAEKFLSKAIQIFREANNYQHLGNFLTYYARIKFKQNNFNEALIIAQESYSLALKSDDLSNKHSSTQLLYEIYKELKNANKALFYFEIHKKFEDQIQNDANKKQLLSFEFDKKISEDSIKNREKIKVKNIELSLANKENEQNKERIAYLIFGLIILIGLILFIFNRFQLIKKQKITIEKQKLKVENQHLFIEEINKQLNASITYAKMIQEAVLPAYELSEMFKESFLIYKPKDIVSGDFYWLEKEKNHLYFSVADCTGHGIPGAFISMIGTILLNEIYNSKKITQANLILNELSRLVQLTLMTKENRVLNDGMDMSFCVFDQNTKKLEFAGANNFIYILSKNPTLFLNGNIFESRKSEHGINIFKINADKKPVGKQHSFNEGFSLNTIQLNKNDLLILMSDGLVDQFGGPNIKNGGKKYKASQLESLLLKEYANDLDSIKSKILMSFENWKGNLEQVDDICLIGVRIE